MLTRDTQRDLSLTLATEVSDKWGFSQPVSDKRGGCV